MYSRERCIQAEYYRGEYSENRVSGLIYKACELLTPRLFEEPPLWIGILDIFQKVTVT